MAREAKWSVSVEGGWLVECQDPMWGNMRVTFPPEDEVLARWVASNHGVNCIWVKPLIEENTDE